MDVSWFSGCPPAGLTDRIERTGRRQPRSSLSSPSVAQVSRGLLTHSRTKGEVAIVDGESTSAADAAEARHQAVRARSHARALPVSPDEVREVVRDGGSDHARRGDLILTSRPAVRRRRSRVPSSLRPREACEEAAHPTDRPLGQTGAPSGASRGSCWYCAGSSPRKRRGRSTSCAWSQAGRSRASLCRGGENRHRGACRHGGSRSCEGA